MGLARRIIESYRSLNEEVVKDGNRIVTRVLWFSQRDGNGIVIDSKRNEYYIDTSVMKQVKDLDTVERRTMGMGKKVYFTITPSRLSGTLVGKDVREDASFQKKVELEVALKK